MKTNSQELELKQGRRRAEGREISEITWLNFDICPKTYNKFKSDNI